MKGTMTDLQKTYPSLPYMTLSAYTRACAIEVMFGDPEEEEPNIAYSICQSLLGLNMEVRGLAAQNIILSGGTCMVPGFKTRLV